MDIKKIGLSTSAFGYSMGNVGKDTDRKNPKSWTLEQFIEFAAEHGFGGIEAPIMRFVPDLDQERLKNIRSLLADKNMFFLMDAESALDAGEIEALIPIAKEFGSPIIRIKSSKILGCAREKLGVPWSEHVETCISILKDIAPKLRENSLRIAVENHQDLDSNDLLKIVEAVGDDVVGVNFDIGNAFSVCEEPINFAQKLAPAIINIHLKDYKIFESEDGFRLARCPIGEGSVDWKAILDFLAKSSPNARMVVELGALEARNVAHLTDGFWKEIAPRSQSETDSFRGVLEQEIIREASDLYKTPWEKSVSSEDIMAYEVSQLETSLNYLSKI